MSTPIDEPMIIAEEVRKRYAGTQALDGFDLHVPRGTVCGLLGPNGAGKTTAVRVLSTLTAFDSGQVRVAGLDVRRQAHLVRFHIGLVGQHPAVDPKLSGRENLRMFGRLYHLGERRARRRADELLDQFGLDHAADRAAGTYSGGMLRRLHLMASLIVSPPLLFLDEPTTGLDPRSRMDMWSAVRELVGNGTTVLLTTQYLDEADRLADQIAVMDAGHVVATGSPDTLKAAIGGRVDVVAAEDQLADAARAMEALTGGRPAVDRAGRLISTPTARPVTLPDVVRALDAAGVTAQDITMRRPTLDEVFLTLTDRTTPDTPTGTHPSESNAS